MGGTFAVSGKNGNRVPNRRNGRNASLGQLASAAVLVGGVALLRPWQAELINVPVFLSGCWFLQNEAPRFVS